jgi:hypothetical protein
MPLIFLLKIKKDELILLFYVMIILLEQKQKISCIFQSSEVILFISCVPVMKVPVRCYVAYRHRNHCVCMYVCVYVCIYVCMYVCVSVYIYISVHSKITVSLCRVSGIVLDSRYRNFDLFPFCTA